jgi:PHD/YefM family antitoxin component YafN of YafNO toxin-antitoxin module
MEIFTLQEWEENFDDLFKRVEDGETIGIVREDGQAAVMMPAEDELKRIHTDHDDAS